MADQHFYGVNLEVNYIKHSYSFDVTEGNLKFYV